MCVQSKRSGSECWICAPAIDSVSFFFLSAPFSEHVRNHRFRFYFSGGLFRSGNFLPFPVSFLRVSFSEHVKTLPVTGFYSSEFNR